MEAVRDGSARASIVRNGPPERVSERAERRGGRSGEVELEDTMIGWMMTQWIRRCVRAET